MTFVYDIYVNFQNICYDFYEWNKKDKITHIKKIPIFAVEEDTFQNILAHDNKIDDKTLELLKDKADIFKKKKKISATLLTNNKDIIAILLNTNGRIIKKSCLLLEEENSILRNIHKIDFLPLTLTEISKNKKVVATREEQEREKFLLNNLSHMQEQEMKYLYFECFGKIKTDKTLMEKEILSEIKRGNEKISSISYHFLKLIGINS